MIYARAHDQTVADDYFAAMQRKEQRLEIIQPPRHEANDEVVKVQELLLPFIQQLERLELSVEERYGIAAQLRSTFEVLSEHPPPGDENLHFQNSRFGLSPKATPLLIFNQRCVDFSLSL